MGKGNLTILGEEHRRLGAKMVEFAGWLMPVQYRGIIDEHLAVRRAAGLFDVSHMGQFLIRGRGAAAYLQQMITNDLTRLAPGEALYSPLCRPDGGTIDDIIIYQLAETEFLLVVNAANTAKDWAWLTQNCPPEADLQDRTGTWGNIALQGPAAVRILEQVTHIDLTTIKYYQHRQGPVCGKEALIARTGYTGEDGFEIFSTANDTPAIWRGLMQAGVPEGLEPVGLGARDTLRLEAALPLYGHELAEDITPVEAGLTKFIRFEKGEFYGKSRLEEQLRNQTGRQRIGFVLAGPGIAREGYPLYQQGDQIGVATSGNYAPALNRFIGMGLLSMKLVPVELLEVGVRGRRVAAKIVEMPFYHRKRNVIGNGLVAGKVK